MKSSQVNRIIAKIIDTIECVKAEKLFIDNPHVQFFEKKDLVRRMHSCDFLSIQNANVFIEGTKVMDN